MPNEPQSLREAVLHAEIERNMEWYREAEVRLAALIEQSTISAEISALEGEQRRRYRWITVLTDMLGLVPKDFA